MSTSSRGGGRGSGSHGGRGHAGGVTGGGGGGGGGEKRPDRPSSGSSGEDSDRRDRGDGKRRATPAPFPIVETKPYPTFRSFSGFRPTTEPESQPASITTSQPRSHFGTAATSAASPSGLPIDTRTPRDPSVRGTTRSTNTGHRGNPDAHLCEWCNIPFASKQGLDDHLVDHHEYDVAVCTICRVVRKGLSDLNRHVRMHHNTSEVPLLRCTVPGCEDDDPDRKMPYQLRRHFEKMHPRHPPPGPLSHGQGPAHQEYGHGPEHQHRYGQQPARQPRYPQPSQPQNQILSGQYSFAPPSWQTSRPRINLPSEQPGTGQNPIAGYGEPTVPSQPPNVGPSMPHQYNYAPMPNTTPHIRGAPEMGAPHMDDSQTGDPHMGDSQMGVLSTIIAPPSTGPAPLTPAHTAPPPQTARHGVRPPDPPYSCKGCAKGIKSARGLTFHMNKNPRCKTGFYCSVVHHYNAGPFQDEQARDDHRRQNHWLCPFFECQSSYVSFMSRPARIAHMREWHKDYNIADLDVDAGPGPQ